jgi:hypothetical protein
LGNPGDGDWWPVHSGRDKSSQNGFVEHRVWDSSGEESEKLHIKNAIKSWRVRNVP